jgi:hypothetical protein
METDHAKASAKNFPPSHPTRYDFHVSEWLYYKGEMILRLKFTQEDARVAMSSDTRMKMLLQEMKKMNTVSNLASKTVPSIKQPLGLIRDSEGPWHEIPPAPRIMYASVIWFFVRGLYDTKEEIDRLNVSFTYNDSLCGVLKITEKNFRQYTMIRCRDQGGMPKNLDLTDRPYSEIKLEIDRWGRSLFLSLNGDMVEIIFYCNTRQIVLEHA